jgi:hypothetical protein
VTRVALLWLIVGLAVGYLLGTLPGESPVPRTGRATPIEMPPVTEPEPQPGKPKPAPRTVVHKPDPVRAPVRSELAAPAAVGMGTLLVDFSGTKFTNPELIGRTIQGSQNTTTVDRDDNDLGRLRLWSDDYVLRLEAVGVAPRLIGVRILAGQTTRLRLADDLPNVDFPIPPGLGRLDVTVSAIGGGPLAGAPLEVTGVTMEGEESVSEHTGADGLCRFHLIDGSYRIRIGGRVENAVVLTGRTTHVTIDYRTEGELVLVPRWFRHVRLRPQGATDAKLQKPALSPKGKLSRFLYVAPGWYDVVVEMGGFISGHGPRVFGEVEIVAGAQTEFRFEWAPGGVRIAAQFEEGVYGLAKFHLTDLPDESFRLFSTQGWQRVQKSGEPRALLRASAWFPYLDPGRYRVTAVARGCRPVTQEVIVGAETVNLEVTFEKDPARPQR